MMRFLLLILMVCVPALSGCAAPAEKTVQSVAAEFVAAYNAGEAAPIAASFNPQMKAAISASQFARFLAETSRTFGKIVKLEAPAAISPGAATFPVVFERGRLNLLLALDENGQIAGLRLAPDVISTANSTANLTAKRPPVRGKTRLALPFRGEWLVFWGGDTVAQNYHQNAPNQRFAFDILKVNASGQTHRGDGLKNDDYFAFNQPILAPANGVVVDVVSGIRDNVPGAMNPMFAPGNMIVIRHPSGEWSLFGHLKLGSTKVKVGDRVSAGQVLGLCGNSGNSSEAHLHFQLQKTQGFSEEGSLKAFFGKLTVRRDGKVAVKSDYSPVKGDLVSG